MPDTPDFRSRYGRVALVAGSAVGLGAEWSRQLAAKGLDLVLVDRDEAPLLATCEAIRREHGVTATPVVLDLGRADLVAALSSVLDGREVGLLVYNAALGTVAPFLDMDPDHMDRMLAVNARAPMQLARALAPAMVARGRGGIVLLSSMSGSVGSAQLAVYAATKAFDLVLADALWAELHGHGIDVLVVQPGSTRTPGWLTSQCPGDPASGPMVMEPAEVVREALDALGGEATHLVPGELNRMGAQAILSLPRRQAIEMMSEITSKLVRNDR
ncbi:MAG: SDR family NAD(P)-dependent oxidoreductase [Alphaproteobacteria bacterium]